MPDELSVQIPNSAEQKRLDEAQERKVPWKQWGPYLSERQWGTVREDYSENGDAWNYFTHDQARSRAYHWGEDGLAGISDDHQRLCFALALWNGKDPILKERLFGLTNSEGNHGEDVKEYYYYLDSTPTHSYMKYLYKYPQNAYPYSDLIENNRHRGRNDSEYELLDTSIFDDDRYFDIFVEYAKAAPTDILIRISIVNHGPEPASLHVLPTLWFRNTWSWWPDQSKPSLRQRPSENTIAIEASHAELGGFLLYCDQSPRLLFTENDTNNERIFGRPNRSPYVKDGINNHVVAGREDAVNPAQTGTKATAHYQLTVGARETSVIRLRLRNTGAEAPFGAGFDEIVNKRRHEADAFYKAIAPARVGEDRANVMRQALAGMLWSKQYFFLDADKWLEEHGFDPMKPTPRQVRNREWFHMIGDHVISMPDKWEYPWFAAWDLAFHTLALSTVDIDFAKEQKTNKHNGGFFMGTGHWTRANPEVCLLATRGNPKRLSRAVRELIVAPRREHSRKPDEIYPRIEALVAGPYLELFARFPRDGWDSLGHQEGIHARRWRSDSYPDN